MDVEKTMDLLRQRAAQHDQAIAALTADVAGIARAADLLIGDQQFLSGKIAEAACQQLQLEELAAEQAEQRKYYDQRFDQTISAIGEYLRQSNAKPPIN